MCFAPFLVRPRSTYPMTYVGRSRVLLYTRSPTLIPTRSHSRASTISAHFTAIISAFWLPPLFPHLPHPAIYSAKYTPYLSPPFLLLKSAPRTFSPPTTARVYLFGSSAVQITYISAYPFLAYPGYTRFAREQARQRARESELRKIFQKPKRGTNQIYRLETQVWLCACPFLTWSPMVVE